MPSNGFCRAVLEIKPFFLFSLEPFAGQDGTEIPTVPIGLPIDEPIMHEGGQVGSNQASESSTGFSHLHIRSNRLLSNSRHT